MGNNSRTLWLLMSVLCLSNLSSTDTVAAHRENSRVLESRVVDLPAATQVVHDPAIAVAAGESFSMALTRSGRVFAWGHNRSGQLGDGTVRDSNSAVAVRGLPASDQIVGIAAGALTAYALARSGKVYAWGSNTFGELGNGTTRDSTTPILVPGLPTHDPVAMLPPGGTLAVTHAGRVYDWGTMEFGITPGVQHGRIAALVSGLPASDPVIAAADGWESNLALTRSGKVYGWGHNGLGALGIGNYDDTTVATPVPPQAAPFAAVAAAMGHSMANDKNL